MNTVYSSKPKIAVKKWLSLAMLAGLSLGCSNNNFKPETAAERASTQARSEIGQHAISYLEARYANDSRAAKSKTHPAVIDRNAYSKAKLANHRAVQFLPIGEPSFFSSAGQQFVVGRYEVSLQSVSQSASSRELKSILIGQKIAGSWKFIEPNLDGIPAKYGRDLQAYLPEFPADYRFPRTKGEL